MRWPFFLLDLRRTTHAEGDGVSVSVLCTLNHRQKEATWTCFSVSSAHIHPPVRIIHLSITRENLSSEITEKQAWLLWRLFTRRRFVSHTPESVCSQHSDKSSDWLVSTNVARDRKHSPSLTNNYPSLHASCQRANSSVIIPLLPVESGWQRAQYQSHSITLLLAFISSTLSLTLKDSGFYFILKTNVSACSAWTLLHIHTGNLTQGCVIKQLHTYKPIQPPRINKWLWFLQTLFVFQIKV